MKVSDETILKVAGALHALDEPLTVPRLRRELKALFGCQAGTDRLYRLLRHRPLPPPLGGEDPDRALIQAQRDAAVERARRAEERFDASQVAWARQIDELRQELQRARSRAARPTQQADLIVRLHRELQQARVRITELERAIASQASGQGPKGQWDE